MFNSSLRSTVAKGLNPAGLRTGFLRLLRAVLGLVLVPGFGAASANAADFDGIPFATIQEGTLSGDRIDGDEGGENRLPVGAIVLYKTNSNRFGKFQVEQSGYTLAMRWVTFDEAGGVFSSGRNLVINGTFSCDLDEGKQVDLGPSADFQWDQITYQIRRLEPKNGARFAVLEQPALIFPQIADGGGIRAEVILTNPDPTPLKGRIRFRDSAGLPLTVAVGVIEGRSFEVELAPGGVARLETEGSGNLKAGYAFFEADPAGSDTHVSGSVVYQYLDFEASVAAAVPGTEGHVFVEKSATADTGIALLNLGPSEQRVHTVLLDQEGELFREIILILGAGEHRAQFVGQIFGGVEPGFQGSIQVYAEKDAVCLIGVRQRSSGSIAILGGAPTAVPQILPAAGSQLF